MLRKTADRILLKNFTLRDALWLGFCATFIVITRAGLRMRLNLTGHAMFFTMFFLLLGRGGVPKMWAATLIGLVAGFLSVLLGMGKGGPLVLLKFLIPALVVDCAAALFPAMPSSYAGSLIVGTLASAGRVLTVMAVDWLVGMDTAVIMQHAALASVMTLFFGCLGAAMVPPVVRRLKANRLIM